MAPTPLGFVAGTAGKKIGKIILQTSVGAAVISGISHLFGMKRDTEIIQSRGVTEMRVERNHNFVELNLAGASSIIAIAIMAIVIICLCGKVKKMMVKRKETKEKKKEEEMEMKEMEKKKEVEREEEEEEDLKMEDI